MIYASAFEQGVDTNETTASKMTINLAQQTEQCNIHEGKEGNTLDCKVFL